jgi:hypothetical protein
MGSGHRDTSRENFVDVHRNGANPNPLICQSLRS